MAEDLIHLRVTVEDAIKKVTSALDSSLAKLNGRMWQTEATKAAINALTSLRVPIMIWSDNGRLGAAAGKAPVKNGWAGWFRAGEVYVDGIKDQMAEEDTATLANVKQSLEDAAKDVERVATKVAKTAKKAVIATGETVGKAAAAAAKPATIPLAFIAIGLVAVAVIMVKR